MADPNRQGVRSCILSSHVALPVRIRGRKQLDGATLFLWRHNAIRGSIRPIQQPLAHRATVASEWSALLEDVRGVVAEC